MNSLANRLQLGLILSLLLLMGLFWLAGYQSLRHLTEEFVISRLEHDAESLLRLIPPDVGTAFEEKVDPIFNQPFSGHYYLILLADGRRFSSRSLWDYPLAIPFLKPGEVLHMHAPGPSGQDLLILVQGFHKGGMDFTLAVTEDLTPVEEQRARFTRNFAFLAATGLIILILVQQMVIQYSMRQINPIYRAIRQLEKGKLEQLPETGPREILPLVKEFNVLLHFLIQRLERSRSSLGNLAHALKGPLNLLQRYFDDPETTPLEEARAQLLRICQLVQRELKRARLAGAALPGHRFNPMTALPDLVNVLRVLYREKELDIRYELPETPIRGFGDEEDMLELLGNLLDNACKWARTTVVCRISEKKENSLIIITIEDDGPGLSSEELNLLTRRGMRLDETKEGDGLGLSIIREIIKLYKGTIHFDRSPTLGGLRVSASLPAPRSTDSSFPS